MSEKMYMWKRGTRGRGQIDRVPSAMRGGTLVRAVISLQEEMAVLSLYARSACGIRTCNVLYVHE